MASALMVLASACTNRDVVAVRVGSVEVQPASLTVLEGDTRRLTVQVRDEAGRSLPVGSVTWSSDAPSVFVVDSTGLGLALAPGKATVSATMLGARGSAQVSVEPGPSIVVSEPSVLFAGTVGGTDPDPVTLEIDNGGGGSLQGISASVRYAEGGATGWLSLALAGTTAPADLVVTGLLGSLDAGSHEATLSLTAQGDGIAPVTVPVRAEVVLDKPIIGLSARRLEFRAQAAVGALPAPETIQVANEGGGVLTDLEATSLYADAGGWLSASLAGSTAPTQLVVQPDPSDRIPGTYAAEIRIHGAEALNTPLFVDVMLTVTAGPASPAHATASVPDGTAGSTTYVVVQARDVNGYALSTGGATVVVTVSGANAVGPIPAEDEGDGTYTATYTPTAAGRDEITITMDGTPVGAGSLTSMVAAGSRSPAHSTAYVPDGSVGSTTRLLIRARDAYGNALSAGGADVVVNVSGANDAGALSVTDRGDGTYTAGYTPASAGVDEVSVTMDGTPVGGSPFTSEVSLEPASPPHSTAMVPDGRAGAPTSIVVRARNDRGEPVGVGGAEVVVTVSGANAVGSLAVTDQDDGTYVAAYTPTVAGSDEITITLDGTPIQGSPFASAVVAGAASPDRSTAVVPDGKEKKPTEILVQARDAWGNPLGVGGATVVVTVSGKNSFGPATAVDQGEGTYTLTYTPNKKGTDQVSITMDGTPIGGSPFTSEVR